jgi:4-amino-4-deoxy-L-arabinose transferase-like glycosyltransferase
MSQEAFYRGAPAQADRGTAARAGSRPEAGGSRWRWLRDPGLAALAVLPIILLAIDSDWIYSGPHRDAWIYYGYFRNAVYYLRQFQDLYYSSRLAVTLPGFLIHHLLPPLAANLALHLALFWAAVLSFYLVAKELFGARAALLAGIALGCHPYFLQAAGWNYVDGFGIAYFLSALLLVTLAARSPSWRPLLLAAGALGAAIVSTHVFYAVYLPLLAGHFAVLNRKHGQAPLLAGALWAGLGAGGLLALLGTVTRLLGGSFFYLRPSLRFLADSVGTDNPFRDSSYSWLAKAVWLVFPALALLGSAILLWRLATEPASPARHRLPLMWTQVQLVLLAVVMLYFQVSGDTAVLEHFYYASLLIPVAFLAFAGQLSGLVEGLPARRFAALAAGVTLLQLAALFLPRIGFLAPRALPFNAPALVALAAGLGTAAASLPWRSARVPAALAVFLCLALSQLVVRQGGTIFRQFERHGGDGRGLFLQVSRGVLAVERADPSQNLRLWYDFATEDGIVYDAIAAAYLLCPRMINSEFPELHDGRMCDGVPLGPDVPVAILSADPAAVEKARAALGRIGLAARLLRREEIAGPSRGFAITYLGTAAGAPP